jgi:hypothetical protein
MAALKTGGLKWKIDPGELIAGGYQVKVANPERKVK